MLFLEWGKPFPPFLPAKARLEIELLVPTMPTLKQEEWEIIFSPRRFMGDGEGALSGEYGRGMTSLTW